MAGGSDVPVVGGVPQAFRVVRVNHRAEPRVETTHSWHESHDGDDCVLPCTLESNSTTVAVLAASAAVLIIFGMVSAYSNWWWPYSW